MPEFEPDIQCGKVIKVYDGDTIAIASKPYDKHPVYKFLVRLNGIEAPEIRRQSPFLTVIPPPPLNISDNVSPRSVSPPMCLEVGSYLSPNPSQNPIISRTPTPSDPVLKGESSPRDGIKVRDLLSDQILGKVVHLSHCTYDKSNHIYADVFYGNLNLNQWLLDLKVVLPCEGRLRKQWPE